MIRNLLLHPALTAVMALAGGLCALASAASGAPVAPVAQAAGAEAAQPGKPALSAHRAVYELALDGGRPASGIAEVAGRMVYEFTGGPCAGYNMTMRFVTRVSDSDGKSVMTDLRARTWEAADGEEFTFNSAQYVDSSLHEAAAGAATRGPDGTIRVALEKPAEKSLTVQADALFPSQHLAALIDAAQGGERLLVSRVYDGSESGDKVYDTTAAIGGASRADRAEQSVARAAEELREAQSWPVTIAYFEQQEGGGEQVPSYQISFNLYPNGVSDGLRLDYGEFALRGSLREIEFLPAEDCE